MVGLLQERQYITKLAQHCPSDSIVQLIQVCTGEECSSGLASSALLLGLLGRTRYKCLEDAASVQYLLLSKDDDSSVPNDFSRFEAAKITLSKPKKQALVGKALEFLVAEISSVLHEFSAHSILTADMAKVITSACIVANTVASHGLAQAMRKHDLQSTAKKLTDAIKNALTSANNENERELIAGAFLEAFAVVIPNMKELSAKKGILLKGFVAMLHTTEIDFWRGFSSSKDSDDAIAVEDAMDDDEFGSQARHAKSDSKQPDISHDATIAASSMMAFRSSVAAKLCFISTATDLSTEGYIYPSMTTSFVKYLTSLPSETFLACRPFIRELFGSNLVIDSIQANDLLEYIGAEALEPYRFERCEVALGICLEIMTGTVDLWTSRNTSPVSEIGAYIYKWFITLALRYGISSPHIHICLSALLQRLIKSSPEYGKSMSLPSARTSLFKVLEDGSLDVKFHAGNTISEIFGLFILKEHESILEDVINTLPKAADWLDGIALRLYVLSHLAYSWPTLLRRCVYAIFETPGSVPASTGHARYCLTRISTTLKLQSSRELFKLFVSQILYTWLETKPLQSMPFQIFGYQSRREMLRDVQDDVAGQVIMRGKDDEGDRLAHDLEKPFQQLTSESFGKAAAYSIARDVAVPPSKNSQSAGAEIRLRKILGKESFASLVIDNFGKVLLVFLKTMDEETSIEKGFSQHGEYRTAYAIYQDIKSISTSDEILPINQQPSFKTRYLFDEIAHLCRRSNDEAVSIWSPSLYVYLFRGLLDTMHPALGSLHACSVIRKLRILVALAGSTALQAYPIEMALHSLRPFLTDTHCAEDSLGIFQYLLVSGEPYIREIPSFVAGMAVVTLVSLKAFLGSSQESTTQESQYKATMSKAGTFHSWFGEYLSKYNSAEISEDSLESFRKMVTAARTFRTNGNARPGNHESDLLLSLLTDQASGRNLLNRPSQDLVFGLLCANFEGPSNFREDILGSDIEATLLSPFLWSIFQRADYGENFLLWVGRVVGRAYAATGEANPKMVLEAEANSELEMSPLTGPEMPKTSRSLILLVLRDLLFVDDRKKVGIAEDTLRSVINKAQIMKCLDECEQVIPPSLMAGLLWMRSGCPTLCQSDSMNHSVEGVLGSTETLSASMWVQQLCVALASAAEDDWLLSELPQILLEVKDIAEHLFPFIVHLTLTEEANGRQTVRRALSIACQKLFRESFKTSIDHVRILIKAILYLRKQPVPQESTAAERSRWLDIDFGEAASAAARCSMFKTSLLFLDIKHSQMSKATRRSSEIKVEEPTDLLLHIYQNIDEPDGFYGVQQPSSLASMMARLEYEHAGFKSLSFRGAYFDSLIKSTVQSSDEEMVSVLDRLDLNGIAQSLLSKMTLTGEASLDSMLRTARKLEHWDVSVPESHMNCESSIFRSFQGVNNATNLEVLDGAVNFGFVQAMHLLKSGQAAGPSVHKTLSTLAVLTEMDEMYSTRNAEQLDDVWSRFEDREDWMYTAR